MGYGLWAMGEVNSHRARGNNAGFYQEVPFISPDLSVRRVVLWVTLGSLRFGRSRTR